MRVFYVHACDVCYATEDVVAKLHAVEMHTVLYGTIMLCLKTMAIHSEKLHAIMRVCGQHFN